MEDEEKGYKVILLGESSVGKTSLIKISIGKQFDSYEQPTLTASYFTKNIKYKKQIYKFYLWDTIGSERYRALTKNFFQNSKIVLLVYDITSKKSFKSLDYWFEAVKNVIGEDFLLAIIGNKIDLYLEEQVTLEEGQKYAEEKKAKFQLMSAKTSPAKFVDFLDGLFIEYIDNYITEKDKQSQGIQINKFKKNKKKRKCC